MSFDEFVDFVESKIAPFTLNESGRSGIALLYNRYPLELLEECINIGISQYFKYDGNGEPTKESVEKFLNKIGGIAYNKELMEAVERRVSFIAPVSVYPGEDEMGALALNALNVLRGEFAAQEYR